MTQKNLVFILSILTAIITSACGTPSTTDAKSTLPPAPTPAPPTTIPVSPTIETTLEPDRCAPENIEAEIENIHNLMREFDDASLLASNTPLEQLNPTIADLQRIRRNAEDLDVPPCLINLKLFQLAHMNTVIKTLLGFLNGTDQETLNQGIALARQQHDQYTLELAMLLGITVVAPPTQDTGNGTPGVFATPTFAGLYITNPGPTAVNIRAEPSLNAATLGIMPVGASAAVLGRTADALWYQIEIPSHPDQVVWVYVSLVKISDPTVELPVVTPNP